MRWDKNVNNCCYTHTSCADSWTTEKPEKIKRVKYDNKKHIEKYIFFKYLNQQNYFKNRDIYSNQMNSSHLTKLVYRFIHFWINGKKISAWYPPFLTHSFIHSFIRPSNFTLLLSTFSVFFFFFSFFYMETLSWDENCSTGGISNYPSSN